MSDCICVGFRPCLPTDPSFVPAVRSLPRYAAQAHVRDSNGELTKEIHPPTPCKKPAAREYFTVQSVGLDLRRVGSYSQPRSWKEQRPGGEVFRVVREDEMIGLRLR